MTPRTRLDRLVQLREKQEALLRAERLDSGSAMNGVKGSGQMMELLDACPLDPAFSETDFKRVRDAQVNALRQDLRTSNEEELAKERLQTNIFRGTPYGHPVLGTMTGLQAITLDDVKAFVRNHYTRGNLMLGINGDVPPAMVETFQRALMALPAGTAAAPRSARAAIKALSPTSGSTACASSSGGIPADDL